MTTQASIVMQTVEKSLRSMTNDSEHIRPPSNMMDTFLSFTLPLHRAPLVYDIYHGAPLSSATLKTSPKTDSDWISPPRLTKEYYQKQVFKSLSAIPLNWTNRQNQFIQSFLDFKICGAIVENENDKLLTIAKNHCLQIKLFAQKSSVQKIRLSLVGSDSKVHRLIKGKMPRREDIPNAGSNFIELEGDLTKFHISTATRKKSDRRDLHMFVLTIETYEPDGRKCYSWNSNLFEISSVLKPQK